MFLSPQFITVLSLLWGTWAMTIYYRGIIKGETKPHLFSWLIWGLIDLVASAAQFAGGAGVGTIPTVYAGLLCMITVGFALKKGEKKITPTDWIMLIAALCALPLWILTDDPLNAVILVTAINLIGYGPTIRKSRLAPKEENLASFAVGGFGSLFMLGSLEQFNLTTLLYPASILLGSSFIVLWLVFWRWRSR